MPAITCQSYYIPIVRCALCVVRGMVAPDSPMISASKK
jgi:hypothetical protein